MRTLLILSLFALSTSLYAKNLKWHEGAVVLNDDHIVTGEISIEPENDLIMLRADGSVNTYAFNKIQSFYFYDAEQNINRKFISLKDHDAAKNKSHLYEVVLRGRVNILRQPKNGLAQESNMSSDNFNYYVRMDNHLTNLTDFRKNVFPMLLHSFHDQIATFIYQNKLNPNSQDSAIKIIEFYNKQESLSTFAKN